MEDFVTWVDTSKLKRTIAKYNDEVCISFFQDVDEILSYLPPSLTISICYDVAFTSGDPKTSTTLIIGNGIDPVLPGAGGNAATADWPEFAVPPPVASWTATPIIDFTSSLRSLLMLRM